MNLEMKQICKNFGSKEVLKGVDIRLENGVYGLLGPNGAGKTTLIRILAGVMNASSGEILLEGKRKEDIQNEYAGCIGYLPQDVDFYPDFTAKEYLNYIAVLKGLEGKKCEERINELAYQVGLSDDLNRKCITFSGGMKRRLGIAQALLNDPAILILDEPTAGLDPYERIKFRNIISAMSKDRIVLLSTHIVSDVDCIAREIIMLKNGVVGKKGTNDELTDHITGNVWEVEIALDHLMEFQKKHIISNIITKASSSVLRVIEEHKPENSAVNVAPNLEDVYLYEFSYQGGK